MRWLLLALLVLTPVVAAAELPGVYYPPGILWQDEGGTLARAGKANCTGAGISCSVSGGTVTINASGGGGTFALTEVEIDFSLNPDATSGGSRFVASKTVTDAAVTTSSKILVAQSGKAATGRQADENEMDAITCRAIPATGQFTLICSCERTVTHGLFRVQYTLG